MGVPLADAVEYLVLGGTIATAVTVIYAEPYWKKFVPAEGAR